MTPRKIAIAGCGTGGLAAAIFLARDGHEVTLFERSPTLKPLGAGLLLQPTGLAVLAQLGLHQAILACGERVDQLYGANTAGRRVMDMRYSELGKIARLGLEANALFGLGIQRGALFQTLLSALPASVAVRTGVTVTALDNQTGKLSDMDGASHGAFDLVVIADGAHSVLRKSFAHLCQRDVAYPWGAAWCLVQDRQAQFAGVLSQRYQSARAMCGILPVGRLPDDASAVQKSCLFWSLPTARFADWETAGLGSWRRDVRAIWPQAAELLAQIQHPDEVIKATYRDVVHSRFYDGRGVLLGDAAHAMSPQLGQGANMALLDARALAQAIAEQPDVTSALRQYDSARRAHVGIYQFISRWLTPFFQSDSASAAWLRDALLYPSSRVPGLKGNSLKVLAGLQQGLFGTWRA